MQKGALLEELKSEFLRENVTRPKVGQSIVAGPELCDFGRYEDYRCIQEMREHFEGSGFKSPYFLSRSGVNRAHIDCGGKSLRNFSGYNYLDLACDPRVIAAATAAMAQYGTAAGASRMVGGEINLHRELEQDLCSTFGLADCVATVGGYACNLMTLGYLMKSRDLIVYDEYMHNSGVMGAVLSGARRLPFKHNDLDDLERQLRANRGRHERVLILVEGVYSMDGDLCDLPGLIAIKRRHHAILMVDEAHSLGVVGSTGRGVAEHYGIDPKEVDILMGTLSKAFASCGGFIGGNAQLVSLLRYFAPGVLLYSTGLTPGNTGAAKAALEIMRAEPERVRKLQENGRLMAKLARERGFDVGDSGQSAVVPMMVGSDRTALALMSGLLDAGILVHAVIYPVVPRHQSRLRFFLTASHEEKDFVYALDAVARILGELNAGGRA